VSAHLFDIVETAIIESRVQRRYYVRACAWMHGVEVSLRNVSRSGAQLACPQQRFGEITPYLEDDCVELVLDLGGRITLGAAVVYAKPADGEELIGVKFDVRATAGLAQVDAYIRALEG